MTSTELIRSLHRIGHLYWDRPDTADCLVKITCLSSVYHERDRHRLCSRCLCNAADRYHQNEVAKSGRTARHYDPSSSPNSSTSLPRAEVAPASAPASTTCFRSDNLGDCVEVLPYPTAGPIRRDDEGRLVYATQPKLAADVPSQHDGWRRYHNACVTRGSSSSFKVGECSRCPTGACLSPRSTLVDARASSDVEPWRTHQAQVPQVHPARRQEASEGKRRGSLPPSMYVAGADHRCTRCQNHQHETLTTYRLHKDFLTSQSTAIRQMVRARASEQVRRTSCPPGIETRRSVSAEAADMAKHIKKGQQHRRDGNGDADQILNLEIAVPDPSSLGVLFEYFYTGDFGKLAEAMESGQARWENVMLNASHLGLCDALKMQLGAWWRQRSDLARPSIRRSDADAAQRMARGSLPSDSQVSWKRRDGAASPNRVFGRPRAYTTGSGQRSMCDTEALTPSRVFSTLSSGLAGAVAEGQTSKRGKRDRKEEHKASYQQHELRPEPRSGTAPTSVRPSAVQQLLLGSKRRRTLSALAYYCSMPSSIAASVKP